LAIILEEQFDSRVGGVSKSGYTEKRVYHVKNEADPTEILEQLKPDIGQVHPTLADTFVSNISIKPLEALELLEVTYDYSALSGGGNKQAQRNEYNEVWSFDMVSQSRTINSVESEEPTNDGRTYQTMVSLYTTVPFPFADTIVIGDNNGQAVGTDVYRPYGALRVNKLYDVAEVTKDFRTTLRSMQNTLNNAPWLNGEFGFEEILFLGSSIEYDYLSQKASVDYNFLFGSTKENVKIKVLDKPATAAAPYWETEFAKVFPFDHIWMRFPPENNVENTANTPEAGMAYRRYPTHVYKCKLYDSSDFSVLGLVGPN